MAKFYNESEEMYLETLLRLKEEKEKVRAIDVSYARNYSRASVSRAMANLKSKGYIIINEDESIELTEKGKEYAISIFDRHKTLTSFLVKIGVNKEVAEEDACKIEHVISDESIFKIKEFLAK